MFQIIIIYMKKLLDSDWLGAVQFKCNTSAEICNTSAKICNTDATYFWIWSFKSELEIDFFLFCYLWTLETSNLRIFHSFRNTFVWINGKNWKILVVGWIKLLMKCTRYWRHQISTSTRSKLFSRNFFLNFFMYIIKR